MQIDKSPFFRKAIIPWYASDTACLIKAVVMLVVVLFGLDGIKVARQIDAYNDYVWVPIMLFVLSVIVFVVNLIRLIKRYTGSSAM
ncbi:MAG: hypothetical protein HF978_15925 [Desulfobacteraceae bacterium]|nr:hypothetical protein [Desulfobacteraceae bacterium]MBC2757031.1 hypothetical protein [Desulfobacteraceae bacterium]